MKIKTNQELKNYEGEPLKEEGKVVFLRTLLVNALNYVESGKKALPVEDKIKAYAKSIEIMKNDEVELNIEELALIKKNINEMYTPLIVGQVVLFLEGAISTGKEEAK